MKNTEKDNSDRAAIIFAKTTRNPFTGSKNWWWKNYDLHTLSVTTHKPKREELTCTAFDSNMYFKVGKVKEGCEKVLKTFSSLRHS